jgi:hypothetical protein
MILMILSRSKFYKNQIKDIDIKDEDELVDLINYTRYGLLNY